MMRDVLLLLLAAFPLMGSPGPATLSLASLGSAFGFRPNIRYLYGIIVGTLGTLLIVASSITSTLSTFPKILTLAECLAVVYITYLAWEIATAPVGEAVLNSDNRAARVATFTSGLALAFTNPKAYAAIGAVYSGHTIFPQNAGLDAVTKIWALTLVIIIVNTTWLVFGITISRFLNNPIIARIINIIFAVLLITSVGAALILG